MRIVVILSQLNYLRRLGGNVLIPKVLPQSHSRFVPQTVLSCPFYGSWPLLVIILLSLHGRGEPDFLLAAGPCRGPARNLGH